jgi:hypothetical protein
MESNPTVSAFAAVARLFWMVLGPGLLFLLAYKIAQNGAGWFTPLSISYLVGLALVVGARHVDPLDAYGEPRARGVVRGYTIGTLAIGILAWVVAHWL